MIQNDVGKWFLPNQDSEKAIQIVKVLIAWNAPIIIVNDAYAYSLATWLKLSKMDEDKSKNKGKKS